MFTVKKRPLKSFLTRLLRQNIATAKLVLCVKLVVCTLPVSADIYISEVVEGTSNNKAIEIANNGDVAVTLTGFELASEFRSSWSNKYDLSSVTIQPNSVWVVANSNSDPELVALADIAIDSFLVRFNGNDALALLLNGNEHDVFGEFGYDDFNLNITLTRCDHTPVTNYQAWQWQESTVDDWSGIGVFNAADVACVPPPVPSPPEQSITETIMSLQGEGDNSPYVDVENNETTSTETFRISGIVSAVQIAALGQDLPKGFFLQDLAGDGNLLTSDAIFVKAEPETLISVGSATKEPIAVGDELEVYGSVSESFGWTVFLPAQDQGTDLIYRKSQGHHIVPQPLRVLDSDATFEQTLERYENMSTVFDNESDMTIARTFGFDFGSFRNNMVVSHGGVNFHPNQHASPGSEASRAKRKANETNRVIIESFNRAPNGIVPWYPDFGSDNGRGATEDYLRVGATLSGIEGVVSYSFGEYRFFVTNQIDRSSLSYTHLKDRSSAPAISGDGLKVATMNVLNFFTSPFGGADNPLDTNRGAEAEADYLLQRAKIVAAIVALDADVIGLMEIENNGFDNDSAVYELIDLVNAELSAEKQYVIARPESDKRIGTDAISSQLIYRRAKIALDRLDIIEMPYQKVPAEFYPTNYDGSWENFRPSTKFMRNAVTPVFTLDKPDGKKLTVSVNHFKSKGSTCWEDLQSTEVNSDGEKVHVLKDNDYQGNCENFRVAAADYLGRQLKNYPGYRVIVGDLNSYANEDPLMVLTNTGDIAPGRSLKAGRNVYVGSREITGNAGEKITTTYGYINIALKKHENTISYSFGDEVGTLDHILVSQDLEPLVTDVTDWNINSVESTLFQYESNFTGSLPKYQDAFRSSDHDPAIVVLDVLPVERQPGKSIALPVSPINMPSAETLKEGESHRAILDLTLFGVTDMKVGERISLVLSDKNQNNVVTRSQLGRIDLEENDIVRGWVSYTFQEVNEGNAVVEGFYGGVVITSQQEIVEEQEKNGGDMSVIFSIVALAVMMFFRRVSSIGIMKKGMMLLIPGLLIGCHQNDQSEKIKALLVITTDRFPEEISWSFTNSKHEVIRTESGQKYDKNQTYQIEIGLDPGGYRFEIKDSGNDGVCCSYGQGSVKLYIEGDLLVDDRNGFSDEIQYVFNTNSYSDYQYQSTLEDYYLAADLLDGYELKTALHTIIKTGANVRDDDDLLQFYAESWLDSVFEDDQTLLDPYSEIPGRAESNFFMAAEDLCGTANQEGDCYSSEYAVPKEWFDKRSPMNTDAHNSFPADGYISGKRGSIPYGEVVKSSVEFVSENGSRVGFGHPELGYSQRVFEPIDEFKGDFARKFFYMATRYENVVASQDWYGNSEETSASFVEDNEHQVYQRWLIEMLLNWNELDPVSQEEIVLNEAAFIFQGNRNPFVDHPEFAEYIWEHEGFDPAHYEFF